MRVRKTHLCKRESDTVCLFANNIFYTVYTLRDDKKKKIHIRISNVAWSSNHLNRPSVDTFAFRPKAERGMASENKSFRLSGREAITVCGMFLCLPTWPTIARVRTGSRLASLVREPAGENRSHLFQGMILY